MSCDICDGIPPDKPVFPGMIINVCGAHLHYAIPWYEAVMSAQGSYDYVDSTWAGTWCD